MTNRDHTFVEEYEGCEITVLVLSRENGWIIEVKVDGKNFKLPLFRDNDNCYNDMNQAKAAGMKWGKARIDEYIRKLA